jgi:ribosomal protein S18 acetylase RimI-like enzyme
MNRHAVRRAQGDDASTVAVLNRHVHGPHVSSEPRQFHATELDEVTAFFAAVLADQESVVFLAEGDEPLGYVWAQEVARPRTAFTNENRLMYIQHLAVAPQARRCGLATALCRAVEDEARQRGIGDLALDHWSFNETAAAFFSRLGYEAFNVRMRRSLHAQRDDV